MKIKIKRLSENAVIPKYTKIGDAGLDLVAVSKTENELYIEYGTGLAIQLEKNHVGLLYPRSSISNYHLVLANCVGVVDENYTGEIKLRFKKTLDRPHVNTYNIGDRVAQLIIMPFPRIEFEEVQDLDKTERGDGGFGSSGK